MPGSPPTFVAVGDLLLDVELARGADAHGASIRVRAGGTALHAAVAAAAAGAHSTAVGRIGDDDAGALLRRALERGGVTPTLAVDPEAPTGTFVLLDGEPLVDRGANRNLVPADLPPLDVAALLVSGYALAHADSRPAALAALAGGARWTGATGGADDYAGVRVLVLNAAEARRLTGAEPEEAARTLAGRHELACVTLGADGALLAHGDAIERCRVEQVVVKPSRGAGDALAAVLLVELARGLGAAAALASACEAGTRAAAAR